MKSEKDRTYGYPGGESYCMVYERALKWLDNFMAEHKNISEHQNILVITSNSFLVEFINVIKHKIDSNYVPIFKAGFTTIPNTCLNIF